MSPACLKTHFNINLNDRATEKPPGTLIKFDFADLSNKTSPMSFQQALGRRDPQGDPLRTLQAL